LGLSDNRIKNMIEWLDIFSDKTIDNGQMTSGDILLNILSEKWKMEDEDKDMVVMQHEIEYLFKGATNKLVSGLVVKGEDSNFSAMAKTVGLPMAILTELLMNKMIVAPTGVLIPTMPAIYRPILKRLEKYNIGFTESITM
jgi:saccharopine dehydrogenase (NADP+, L-glutamate forming)